MKPLAEHGTTARAKGRPARGVKGCPCAPCRTAEATYDKKRRFLNATGRTLMVDATPVAEHLRQLFSAGAGWHQIATAAESSTATVHAIITGRITQCRRVTASKFLAIKAQDVIPSNRAVDACGSIRRMHALLALGHTNKAITVASGVEHSMLSDLINERLTTVTRHVADRIDIGFRALAAKRGTSARNINRARRNNWAPPAAWDDEAIDDPARGPETGADAELGRRELAAYRRQEIAHLASFGIPEREIAARLDLAGDYVHDLIRDMRKAA